MLSSLQTPYSVKKTARAFSTDVMLSSDTASNTLDEVRSAPQIVPAEDFRDVGLVTSISDGVAKVIGLSVVQAAQEAVAAAENYYKYVVTFIRRQYHGGLQPIHLSFSVPVAQQFVYTIVLLYSCNDPDVLHGGYEFHIFTGQRGTPTQLELFRDSEKLEEYAHTHDKLVVTCNCQCDSCRLAPQVTAATAKNGHSATYDFGPHYGKRPRDEDIIRALLKVLLTGGR